MKIFGFVRRLNPVPVFRKILQLPGKLNPIKPLEAAMNTVVLSVIKKFTASAVKALITTLVAALSLAAGAPAPTDNIALLVWTAAIGAIHAAISALGRLTEHWFGIGPQA